MNNNNKNKFGKGYNINSIMQQSKFNCFNFLPNFYLNFGLNNHYKIDNKINEILSESDEKSKKEKIHDSNSMSHLSTTSEGEQSKSNNKNENLENQINKGIKNITNCCNSNKLNSNSISLSCYYYCDIALDENKKYLLDMKMKNLIDDFQKEL